MRRHFLTVREKIQNIWRRILAVISLVVVSAGLAVSPASAQFLSDGVTPVTPLTTSDFVTAVTQCTIESPVTGICPIYGDASGFKPRCWGC